MDKAVVKFAAHKKFVRFIARILVWVLILQQPLDALSLSGPKVSFKLPQFFNIGSAEAAEILHVNLGGMGYDLTDVTPQTQTAFFGLRYNRVTRTYFGSANITNISGSPLSTPMILVFQAFSDPSITLARPDGQTTDGQPYKNLTPLVPGGELASGAVTGNLVLELNNPNRLSISFTAKVFAQVAAPPQNHPPVANAGPDQTAHVTDTVILDGSGSSDVDGNRLTFSWAWVSTPPGSTTTLLNPTSAHLTSRVDKPGAYVLELVVNDGTADSAPDTVTLLYLGRVPDVVGLPEGTAQATITAANFSVGAISNENNDTVPAGNVIRQDPTAGTSLEAGSSIHLVVSLGPLAPQLSLLEIFPPRLALTAQGETHPLSVTGIYSDGAKKNLTWSAQGTTYAPGDANILNVTSDGLVSALNSGTTTVTVSNGAISTQIQVAVDIRIAPPPDPTAYISGVVLDAKTNQPVVDAGIEEASLGAIVNTDAAGKFVYSVPQGGSYRFYISKSGYVTAKQEIVVDSGQNRSMSDTSLTPYETFTTQITAAEGGTATNAEGTTEIIFPPGALPSDIALSITRFQDEKGHPVGVPKGQVFVDSVQFFPEHIDFNQEVTPSAFPTNGGFPRGPRSPLLSALMMMTTPSASFPTSILEWGR